MKIVYHPITVEIHPSDVDQDQRWYVATDEDGAYICTVCGWVPFGENRRVWCIDEEWPWQISTVIDYVSRDEAVRMFIKYRLRLED